LSIAASKGVAFGNMHRAAFMCSLQSGIDLYNPTVNHSKQEVHSRILHEPRTKIQEGSLPLQDSQFYTALRAHVQRRVMNFRARILAWISSSSASFFLLNGGKCGLSGPIRAAAPLTARTTRSAGLFFTCLTPALRR